MLQQITFLSRVLPFYDKWIIILKKNEKDKRPYQKNLKKQIPTTQNKTN